ncbi:hypothetical protein [Olivibacter domesticus]|nr:hypothetical protein [Olivibacter domesticus]
MLVAMLGLAITFFAFKTEKKRLANDHWFEVVNNQITSTYLPDGPGAQCQEDDTDLEMCAARLLDSQVDDPNASIPTPTITNPSLTPEQKYSEPE